MNREQRRAKPVRPDPHLSPVAQDHLALKMSEWLKPAHKRKLVSRGEFMAVLVQYDRQRKPWRRAYIALLYSRPVQFVLFALGMTMDWLPHPLVVQTEPSDLDDTPPERVEGRRTKTVYDATGARVSEEVRDA